MFVILFLFLFAQYMDFLNCDLAVRKFVSYLCVTDFKMTKKHPYTESILVT